MEIKRSGSQPSAKGLTGDVRIDPLFEPPRTCFPTIGTHGNRPW